jgi:hypothetical protein
VGWLESSLEGALESVGCPFLVGSASYLVGVSPVCELSGDPIMLCTMHLQLLTVYAGTVVKLLEFTMYSYTPPVAPHPVYIATHLSKHCKTRSGSIILDVHIVVYEFSSIFQSQPDDGPPRKGPKHVVVFFNNLKIQLCYDGHLYT